MEAAGQGRPQRFGYNPPEGGHRHPLYAVEDLALMQDGFRRMAGELALPADEALREAWLETRRERGKGSEILPS